MGSDAFPAAVQGVMHLHGREGVVMVSGLIEGGNNHTASHIGLGNESVLLESLVSSGRIAAHSFGLDAGSQSHAVPRSGGLVLGGYDDGAREGGEWTFALSLQHSEDPISCLGLFWEPRHGSGAVLGADLGAKIT
jgi:hypothetical protein